ncbi:MAG: S9 family peptidase [Muribaculaceae bacterium]|nr:S9 family peptidase [Muribaculaceae bacterium]
MNKFFITMALAFAAGSVLAAPPKINYPAAERQDTVDNYFGTDVPDPYRWLEDDNSAATAQWVKEENKITQDYLKKIPFRDAIRKRITELANYQKMGTPFIVAGKQYFFFNDGLQNQSVLYVNDTPQATFDKSKARVVLDPNTLSTDGTVALQQLNFSRDGRYMAYVITRNGSDWNEIYVMDLTTGKQLDDHITWAKFTDAQWLGDGFFYSAYDAPEDAKSSVNEFHKVYYHKLGTPQSSDYVEYRSMTNPLLFYQATVSEDERFVFMWESDGDGNALYVKDLKDRNPHYVCLANDVKFTNSPIGVDHGKIYVMTNANAPKWKLVAYDAENLGAKNVADFVPEKEWVLSAAQMTNHRFILSYDKDASTHAFLYDKDGRELNEIKMPALGSVDFSTKNKRPEVYYRFTSYTFPPTIYSYDTDKNESTQYFAPQIALKPADYVTEQVFYPSKDGTKIPMFLIYKKGLKRDGQRPVFLYGYGGFNISMNPGFSYSRTPFAMLDQGGICAYTNLRGGGEYGEQWHEAGTKLKKQNVFDDFIAAAEYLINEGYTHPGKIACNGGSNGGLLVGAVVNQRPDLWGAAVPQVGVMDMLRYHKFTIGWNWAHDYGRSDDNEEMFRYLLGYSPLHTIKNDNTPYPPIMITTSDHDDRVVPAHSFKYAAQLQWSKTGPAPKLIRIDVNAGHGHGKPVSKVIDEYTDIQSFIMYNLGVNYKKK